MMNGKKYDTANARLKRAWYESIKTRLEQIEIEVEQASKHRDSLSEEIQDAREQIKDARALLEQIIKEESNGHL